MPLKSGNNGASELSSFIFGAIAPILMRQRIRPSGNFGFNMTKMGDGQQRGRGRPAAFNRAKTLQIATTLFWDRGYEGTSVDDLVDAVGISTSSFYNSFGSKERIYQEATEAYMASSSKWFRGELEAPGVDTRSAFENVLKAAARQFTSEDLPTGCMISLAGLHVPPTLNFVHDLMADQRKAAQTAMADRIRRGIKGGDVPKGTNAEALAAFYSAFLRGMAVQARDSAPRKRLLELVRIAMQAWPRTG